MQLAFDDDQLAFRDAVRDLLADQCPPSRVRSVWEDESGVLPDVWSKLAGMGVVGMTAPEAAGGLGMGPLDWVLLFEEAGRVALPGPLIEVTAVALPLLGDAPLVRQLAEGSATVGADLMGTGLCAHAPGADALLLRAPDGAVHLLPTADVSLEPVASVDHARPLSRVTWSPTPSSAVATVEAGDDAASLGALAAAATLVGLGHSMLDATVEYAKERRQFGVPIGTYQAVKHHLADVLVALSYARPVVHAAAWHHTERTAERHVYASMGKAYASDAAVLASKKALQVHGAIGYTWEHDLQLFMKQAWALAAAWGDAHWHRRRVEAALLGP